MSLLRSPRRGVLSQRTTRASDRLKAANLDSIAPVTCAIFEPNFMEMNDESSASVAFSAAQSNAANAAAAMIGAPESAASLGAEHYITPSNVTFAAVTTTAESNIVHATPIMISATSHAPTAIAISNVEQSSAAIATAAMSTSPSVPFSDNAGQQDCLLQAMQKQIQELTEQVRSSQFDLKSSEMQRRALEDVIHRNAMPNVSAASPLTLSYSAQVMPFLPPSTATLSNFLFAEQSTNSSNMIHQSAYLPALPTSCLTYSQIGTNANIRTTATPYPSFQPLPTVGNAARNSCFLTNAQTSNSLPNSFANIFPTSPISQPRKLIDLPEFSGLPEDWPLFSSAYAQTPAAYNYSSFENNQRLQKSIKGEARETVKSLLIHPDNVSAVMSQLQFRYGRPEQLIRSQLRQVRELAPISENAVEKLIPFATKANNLAVFLQSVNGQQHLSNPTLLEELIGKLPMSKRIEWARFAAPIQPYPTIIDFSNWLTEIANLICTVHESRPRSDYEQKWRVVLHAAQGEKKGLEIVCPVCQGRHEAEECKRFRELNVNGRWSETKRCRMCFTCLQVGHSLRSCSNRKPCLFNGCQKKHHKLLHETRNDSASSNASLQKGAEQNGAEVVEPVLSCVASPAESKKLLFRVVPVILHGPSKRVETYALMDEGSSITMMSSDLIEELGLQGQKSNLNVQWFGGTGSRESAMVVDVYISGTGMKKKHFLRHVYGVSNLCLPKQSLKKTKPGDFSRQFSTHMYTNAKPQLLIGLDHCHLGLPTENIQLREGGPFTTHTELGWVVFGPTNQATPAVSTSLFINSKRDEEMHEMIAEYFKVEDFGVRSAPAVETRDDVRARSILEASTKRVNGRFQTGLLWKNDDVQLPHSFAMAEKRLISIERKMKRDETFAASYKGIIQSYVDKNYARKLHPEKAAIEGPRTRYLPHFGVVNPNKPRKLRLVFDAAAAVDGTSLNSCLLKGPQQYQPMPSVLFNFRLGKIAVCGDIREMFHQVMVQPEDRCAQRFLWREGVDDKPPDVYEMLVITFGASCSPCAAQFVKNMNALEHRVSQPRAVKAILEHHYVDDYVDSYASVHEAIIIAEQVRDIHKAAGFELHKFASNSSEVVNALSGGDPASTVEYFLEDSLTAEKVLGLYWQPQSDTFQFKLKFHRVKEEIIAGNRRTTKRELLSIAMSVFDPLGFLCNFMISAKLLMREVWRLDIGWDEPLPNNIYTAWCRWFEDLKKVVELRIPRHYFLNGQPRQLDLHIFVDASEEAFSAVAYWRSVNEYFEVQAAFVCAKTKCAPLKPMTVPRLELQAAVLGARMMQTIINEHSLEVNRCILWSDSKTVIKWIGSENRRYKPFVAHRIAEILAATEISNWRWIPTKDNPADEATRSNWQAKFSSSSRWYCGPEFLMKAKELWPTDTATVGTAEEDSEELPSKYSLLALSEHFIDFKRFSSFCRLRRTIAWIFRFVDRCRGITRPDSIYGLTAAEIEAAEVTLCRFVQTDAYAIEMSQIRNGKCVAKGSAMYKLSPYIDEKGTLRVGGRIDAASYLPFCTRRPIILPPDHAATKLIVAHYHCKMKHQNLEATICEVRRKFWIPRLRQVMRSVLANCYVCKILRVTPVTPMMGSLPSDPLTPHVKPFAYTGVDYFGPLTVTIGRRTEKRWVALFTCLAVRAVHLEVAFDLSTDACILAIRNFINRRGVSVRIRSDNGKNFVGADLEAKGFSEVFESERIQNELSSRGIEWVFNCPSNHSEGGVWERMVQCVKRVLRHTLKEVSPREYTLQSFIIEAENVVNSRPLTHLPITADQEEPLTPNHFLLGSANTAQTPCVGETIDKPVVMRKQWRIARQLRDRFWKRWVAEYLPTLLRRTKWCQPTKSLQEGDLVFICDENLPRKLWCRGRVERVYFGGDGVVRRADVRTRAAVLRRPVSKLAILDVDCGESESIHGEGDVPE